MAHIGMTIIINLKQKWLTLSLKNIISDIEPNDSNNQEKIWCKSLHKL